MSGPPKRIAIVKLGAIGDVVNTLPFVNRLRRGWPDAHITWLIAPLAHGLIEGHAAIDELLVIDIKKKGGLRDAWRALRERQFDLGIDLQRITKSGLLTRMTRAPRRLGFDRFRCKELAWLFSNERIPPNPKAGVTVEQYLEFADYLELPAAPLEWRLPYEAWEEPAAGPRIVVNVGASKEANRWAPERWGAVCAALQTALGATIELTGGPEDRAATARVAALAPGDVHDRAGTLDLKRTAGLIAAADLFVGGDTGPLHIAVAVGTPTVSIYGAADPARTGPLGDADWVVRHVTPCSPCRKRTCHVQGHPCMTDLAPERVVERVLQRLRGPAPV